MTYVTAYIRTTKKKADKVCLLPFIPQPMYNKAIKRMFLAAHLTRPVTIILSVIAIVIAIWSSRQTSRKANQQIKEIIRLYLQQNKMFNLMIESEISNALESIRRSEEDFEKIRAEDHHRRQQYSGIQSKPDPDTQHRKQLTIDNIKKQEERIKNLRKLQQTLTTE
jgi:hypothetical protein